jgi:hypothetical protein
LNELLGRGTEDAKRETDSAYSQGSPRRLHFDGRLDGVSALQPDVCIAGENERYELQSESDRNLEERKTADDDRQDDRYPE